MSQRIVSSALDRTKKENCTTVLLYHSLPDEVHTHELVATMSRMGYKVLLPTVVGNDLELHEYVGEDSMRLSESFGIQESYGPVFTDYAAIGIAFVPGMAFTSDGCRLGRGKGYYDRLLPRLRCPLVGLAFPFQILDEIPCEVHDINMNEVIYG